MSPKPRKNADLDQRVEENRRAILESPSYRLAEIDVDFIGRPEQRPDRMQLELLKADTGLREHGVRSAVVVFGGTQIVPREEAEKRVAIAERELAARPDDPQAQRDAARAARILANSHFYDEAREFSRIASTACQDKSGKCD